MGGRRKRREKIDYFCGLVFGGCDEVGSVWCPLEIFDLLPFFMGLEVLQQFSSLRKVLMGVREVFTLAHL